MVSGCCRVAVGGSNTSGQAVSQASESRPDYTLAGEQAEEGGQGEWPGGRGRGRGDTPCSPPLSSDLLSNTPTARGKGFAECTSA